MRRPGGIRRVKAPRPFRGHRLDNWRGRSTAARVAVLGVLASLLTALPVASSVTAPAQAASSCPGGGCAVTVDAHDSTSGSALANFNFIVNDDNSKLPSDPQALSTESYTPLVAAGNQDHATVNLPAGRYLITVRSSTTRCGALTSPCPTTPQPTEPSLRGSTSPRRARLTRCRRASSGSSCSRTTPGPTALPIPRRPRPPKVSAASRSG